MDYWCTLSMCKMAGAGEFFISFVRISHVHSLVSIDTFYMNVEDVFWNVIVTMPVYWSYFLHIIPFIVTLCEMIVKCKSITLWESIHLYNDVW